MLNQLKAWASSSSSLWQSRKREGNFLHHSGMCSMHTLCPGLLSAVSSTWIWFWDECGRERLESLPQETMDLAWVFFFFFKLPTWIIAWVVSPDSSVKWQNDPEYGTSCWSSNSEGPWKGCHYWARLWSHVGGSECFPWVCMAILRRTMSSCEGQA